MASSLLALLDDISTLLDDVSTLTQAAARKTAGVLGDDLALNAQQVTGVHADRELPVVWAVACVVASACWVVLRVVWAPLTRAWAAAICCGVAPA